jgi:hypothetical protein
MKFTAPIPFREATDLQSVKSILPTTMDSAALSQLATLISERAVFSATTNNAWYLSQIGGTIADMLDGNLDRATARVQLQEALRQISYQPTTADAGTIKDLSSSERLNLILDTNVATAAGYGRDAQAQDPDILDAFPAQELYRAIEVKEPRDWPTRWRNAAQIAGDPKAMTAFGKDGRMIARKDSPIWEALGNPANFDDALGNPYAPFAWNSGMRTRDIDRLEAQELGLIAKDEQIQPRQESAPNLNDRLKMSAADLDADLRQTLLDQYGDLIQFDGENLTLK